LEKSLTPIVELSKPKTAVVRIIGFHVNEVKGATADPESTANEAMLWAKYNELNLGTSMIPNYTTRVMLYRSRLAFLIDEA